MNRLFSKLVLYRTVGEDEAVKALREAFKMIDIKGEISFDDVSFLNEKINEACNIIISFAQRTGVSGNIWVKYLISLFLKDENIFSWLCDKEAINKEKSLKSFAKDDLTVLKELCFYDMSEISGISKNKNPERLKKFDGREMSPDQFSLVIDDISDKICAGADGSDLVRIFADVYKKYGTGEFAFEHAFRIPEYAKELSIVPVTIDKNITFDALIGYELQKKRIRSNTTSFCKGRKANDVLLYGDNGTGKSTSIKALLNEYKDKRLRLVELNKYQFRFMPELISYLKDKNYKFIIFIDDLSFEEDEIEYKYLKSAIEGGIESRPSNILIYATSNRRHLIKEMWSDREDMEHKGEIHRSDTMEEKISLSSRFGETINFSRPDKKEFEQIVLALAKQEGIDMDEETLLKEANKWELRHGGFTGRVARQFINHILSL